MVVKRAIALALLLALSACARGAEVHLLPEDELPPALFDPTEQSPLDSHPVRALVYFVRTDNVGKPVDPPRLDAVTREHTTDRPTPEFVIRQLLAGVTAEERSIPARTAIPVGTELLGVFVRNGVADVNLTAQFEAAGPELFHLLRIAQVVWTLTELPEVDSVRFRIHGAPQPVIDQFGVAHALVSRGRYSRLAPRDVSEPDVVPGPLEPASTD